MVHGICEIISTGNSKTHFLEREKDNIRYEHTYYV